MTKSLEQIQQENRKFILEAIHGCSYEEALKIEEQEIVKNSFFRNNFLIREYIAPENIYIHFGKPLTLSRVLLAFKNKEVKTCYGDEIIFNIAGSQFCGLSVEDEEAYATTYTVYGICLWNLALGEIEITLEEQTEETQRKINELFND